MHCEARRPVIFNRDSLGFLDSKMSTTALIVSLRLVLLEALNISGL